MKRLCAFGCSYTSYSWPTWADLLAYHFDGVENWASPGIGNRAIAESVAECHARYPITQDDVVIVQWSSHLRNDWYHINNLPDRLPGWQTAGSIFNYKNQPIYDRKWIETFFYEPAYFMHTLNAMMLVQGILESTGCTWYMTSIGDVAMLGADMRDGVGYGEKTGVTVHMNASKTAWETMPKLRCYKEPIFDKYKSRWLKPIELHCQNHDMYTYEFFDEKNQGFLDLHPSVNQASSYLKAELADKLAIDDSVFDNINSLSVQCDKLLAKYKYNKRAFEVQVSRLMRDQPESKKIVFPTKDYLIEQEI